MGWGRLDTLSVLLWIATTTASLTLGVLWTQRARRSGWRLALALLAIATPVVALAGCFLAFGLGGHPLVQYNHPGAMRGWYLWASLWPVLILAAPFSMAVSLGLIVSSRSTWKDDAAWALTLGSNGLTLWAVFQNFPSA